MNVKIEQSWKDSLSSEFNKEYFIKLTDLFAMNIYLARKYIQNPRIFLTHLIYVHLIVSRL